MLPLVNLPSDLHAYLLRHIAESVDALTLTKLVRVNHDFYDHCIPVLYNKVEVNKANATKVFYGINYAVIDEAKWKAMRSNRKKSYKTVLASHQRKIKALNKVKTLNISDFEGAEAIACALSKDHKGYFDEVKLRESKATPSERSMGILLPCIPDGPAVIFTKLENIALGLRLLMSHQIYPHCAHHGEFPADPVATMLSQALDCQNVCYDARASEKHHAGDEAFGLAIGHIVRGWKRKTTTWHGINEYPMPCGYNNPAYRLYVNNVHPTIGLLDHLTEDYDPLTAFIAWYVDMEYWCCAHPRKEENSYIEIAFPNYDGTMPRVQDIIDTAMAIYLDIFWEQTSGEDDIVDCMRAAEKRWEERKDTGWIEKHLKVVDLDESEVCVCCGTK
ncbi:uncharacterized protein I303_102304 [Kwoniella dejecticola CBS 10117]|uniref:Uncharacterized protein n=1 Tax=Kwoniella dejecticola CBS 10117 TaxID=1296121 RepID=A0AAJ8KJY3_9TREE